MKQESLDQDAVNLAKAIRQTESGGNFQARGKSGEYGAYQFTKPTWDTYAKKHGVSSALDQATPEQQNEVAYKQIKEWKDQGYNPGQIASLWNSGKPDAYLDTNYKGVNKHGVTYDVPAYAKSVATAYQSIKNGSQVNADPNNPSSTANTTPVQKQETTLKDVAGSVYNSLASPFIGLAAAPVQAGVAAYNKLTDSNVPDPYASGIPSIGKENTEVTPLGLKEKLGDVAQAASSLVPELKAVKGVGLLSKMVNPALQAGVGLGLYSSGEKAREGANTKDIINTGLEQGLLGAGFGGTLGAGIGVLSKVSGLLKNPKVVFEEAKNAYTNAIDNGLGKYAKGTGQTMFEYGIDHNQSGLDAAFQIRNEIANPLEKQLTEVLKTANNYTPVDTWLKSSLANIKSGTGNYSAISNAIKNHIEDVVISDPRYSSVVIKNAEGGLSLPDWALNELKQQNWVNSKFNPLGDPASTIKAEANQAMGRAGRKIIESNTKDLDVGEYNKELGKLYNAADVLEKKGDKPLFVAKTNHLVNKIVGGLAGVHSGALGTLLAAHTADELASRMVNIPMIVRKSIAEKFAEKGKSEIFEQATELLNKMKIEKASQLKLPAPSYIPMGAEKNTTPGIVTTSLQAKKGLVGVDPKTKKFIKTFTSEGTPIKQKEVSNPFPERLSKGFINK